MVIGFQLAGLGAAGHGGAWRGWARLGEAVNKDDFSLKDEIIF